MTWDKKKTYIIPSPDIMHCIASLRVWIPNSARAGSKAGGNICSYSIQTSNKDGGGGSTTKNISQIPGNVLNLKLLFHFQTVFLAFNIYQGDEGALVLMKGSRIKIYNSDL